jgi:SAM-dependent methyltransferase
MRGTKTEKIRQHYNTVAETYDHHYDHRRGKKYHTHLSNHLMKALPEGGNLLDIGCGTGLFVEKYIHNGGQGTGLDISEKMVAKARNRCPDCEFIPSLYKIGEKIKIKHVVMKDFGEHYYNEKEMYSLFDNAGFSEVDVKWCSFAHIDMIDPIFSLATKVEPFVEKSVPQLAFNIFVSAKKE